MKVKFHRTVQNATYYTYSKLNTSRDTLSSRRSRQVATRDVIALRRLAKSGQYAAF